MTDANPQTPATSSSTRAAPPIDLRITGDFAVLRDLSPDDVIVVSCDRPLAGEVVARLQKVLRHELKNSQQRILVFDSGLALDVLPVRPRAAVAVEDAAGVAALRAELASVWKRMDALLDEVSTTDASVEVLRTQFKQLAARA